jgi:hypothetical protein
MTPEQTEILELIERILRLYDMESDYDMIRLLLLAFWAGGFDTAGYREVVKRLLLEWARQRGELLEAAIENALKLSGEAAGGAPGAIALPLIVPLLLLLAGIVLPASAMGLGEIGLQSPLDAYLGDDCEDFYSALSEAYLRLRRDYRAFNGGAATRQTADALLKEAAHFQDACARFHKKCPDSPRNGSVISMQNYTSTITTAVLNWLATH